MSIIKINSSSEEQVKINNHFIEGFIKGKLKVVDQKILYLIVSKIANDDNDDNFDYELTTKEIKKVHKLDTHFKTLSKMCERLLDIKFGFINNEKEELKIFNGLDSIDYSTKQAIINVTITKSFKNNIKKLDKGYTQYQLCNIQPLKSVYSVRLYNMIRKIKTGWTIKYETLDELRTYLGTQASAKTYSNLKKLLVKSQAEISKYCDRTFLIDEIKHRSKVVGIKFTVVEKEYIVENSQPELNGMPINSEKLKLELEIRKYGFTANFQNLCNLVGGWQVVQYYWIHILKAQVLYGNQITNKGGFINSNIQKNARDVWLKKTALEIAENNEKRIFENKETILRAERLSKEADEAEQVKTENIEMWNNFNDKQQDFLCEVRNKTKSDNMPYDDIYDLVLESVANEEFKKIK